MKKYVIILIGAISINGTRSGSEDSSLNVLYLCAPFLLGDYMYDNKYMKMALKEAKKAYLIGEIPVGAVIVYKDKVIAKAYNEKEKYNDVTRHAEITAIRKASKKLNNWRLNDCIMYITLFPCPMCASAINQARISKVVYGTVPNYDDYEKTVDILNNNYYGNPVDIAESLLNEECRQLIQDFFKKMR